MVNKRRQFTTRINAGVLLSKVYRRAIGVDKESKYIDVAIERINDLQAGSLKLRELGKPIHVPTGKEKVSQVPTEWSTNE